MTMQEMEPFLEQVAKGIAKLFGSNCEVAVHDLVNGVENSIILIQNGDVTGRKVGDGSSEKVLQALKMPNVEDEFDYLARTKEGKILKSATIFLRDENGKPIGLFGINYDITDLIVAENALKQITSSSDDRNKKQNMEPLTTNVNDLLDILIEESNDFVGKPVAVMSKTDKVKAIQFLNERGAFLIKKSSDKISKYYDISKYTLYNYLDIDTK